VKALHAPAKPLANMATSSPPRAVRLQAEQTAEQILDAFDVAWQTGQSPSIEAFLEGAAGPARRRLLEELIPIDLEYRWRVPVPAGDPVGANPRLDVYLRRFPELGAVDHLPVALIAEEYRVRHWWGDRPDRQEFVTRFPHGGAALLQALQRIDLQLEEESVRRRKSTLPSLGSSDETPLAGTAALPIQAVSVSNLVDMIAGCGLLDAARLDELRDQLCPRFPEPLALARELLGRDWLTPYQINHLLQGREADLLLGPYVLLERLGEGGTGWVFKAWHQHLGRLVALKVLRRELLADPEVVARFYREIQVVSQLAHPNVVHAYDAGPIGDDHVLVMEYAEGIDLSRLVRRRGPLPLEEACDYIRQAALGLQHIHERGQLHRDVKPSNLLVTGAVVDDPAHHSPLTTHHPPPVVQVLDLGLAKLGKVGHSINEARLPGGSSARLTPDGAVVVGTPDYLAPEQAADFKQADRRADIYSLGCTLFFLLMGRPPFPGGSLGQKLARHQSEEPPDIRSLRPDVPDVVAVALSRMLAKDPQRRYPSAEQVVVALSMVDSTGKRWTPTPRPRRRLWPWLALGAAALLLLVGAWFVSQTGNNRVAPVTNTPGNDTGIQVLLPLPLFSTGIGDDGAPLAGGAGDPHWTVAPAGSGPIATYATRNAPPTWMANTAEACWISPHVDGSRDELAGLYVYRTTFDLTGFDPTTVRLVARVAADNALSAVRLNGRNLNLSMRGFESAVKLSIAGRCEPGVNALEFVVLNDGPLPSPTGLLVELSGDAVPLPDSGLPRLVNPGFEKPGLGSGPKSYAYGVGAGWAFGGAPGSGSGITANANAFTAANPPAPEGTQVAFLQGQGNFAQAGCFPAGTYTLSFQAAQRGSVNVGGQDFQVLVDGKVVGRFDPTGPAYREYTTRQWTVTAGRHVIQFQGLCSRGGDNTAFIDAVRIRAVK
jgi:serine/threonine protein kinase